MTDIEKSVSELRDVELDAITGGFAGQILGVCEGCTTPYRPTPLNPHPNTGGENPYLPGGEMRR